jgi:hypothetical protein
MNWSDLPRHPSRRVLRQFAVAWLIFFVAIAVWEGLRLERVLLGWGLGSIAVVVGVSGLLWPPCVRGIFLASLRVTLPIGWLISLLMLGLIYFGVITPFAAWFRLRGRDALRRKPQSVQSYWQTKEAPTTVRRYFKQY